MTDLEREAREAALRAALPHLKLRSEAHFDVHGVVPSQYESEACVSDFISGYLAAAAPRDQEIERLRAELAKVTEQRDAWPKYHGTAVEGLMILHDRKDLQDLAGLRCGDFMANAVPHIVAEIDRLRAREKLWSEYVALMVESEKLTITMFHVHGGRFPVEMIERGKRLRYALGLE